MIWLILISAFTLHSKTNITKEGLIVKESQSVLTTGVSHNIDGFYINSIDFSDQSGQSLFFDRFISHADLTQHINPTKEFLLHQNPFIKENQKRTGFRFFAYQKN